MLPYDNGYDERRVIILATVVEWEDQLVLTWSAATEEELEIAGEGCLHETHCFHIS